ncbi:MAG: arsenosugar biosynthesis radical SAM (seleno)protein ArsS [Planctomycetaceae bacterium]|jgi:radical SAM/Cys-rich protein
MPPVLTLLRSGHPLADPRQQLARLDGANGGLPFAARVAQCQSGPLRAEGLEVLQVNVGRVCNQTCRHCHVDAGPDRAESMTAEVAAACLDLLARGPFTTLDITGGAPEMNPQFRRLVEGGRDLGRRIIDRCNLTILEAPGYADLAGFLAQHEVEVVASLPCYLEQNVDRQRGDRVFERSLAALRRLNSLGYGRPGSPLTLTLVFNPGGPSLPPPQQKLEADYRRELRERYGIEFTRLFTITNMPISRFLEDLLSQGRLEEYLQKLVQAFNPGTIDALMCRTTLSVDWQGRLFDCDFNQMLDLPVAPGEPTTVFDLTLADLERLACRPIQTAQHCYGCTAGAGSSCGGSLE